jgi:hypothetical protein
LEDDTRHGITLSPSIPARRGKSFTRLPRQAHCGHAPGLTFAAFGTTTASKP